MEMKIIRKYRKADMEILKKSIRRKFGRIEKVKKLLQIKKCSQPEIGEAYMFYMAMDNGIEETVIVEDKKVFTSLSAKRFEIIEFLNKNGPASIKEIARKTRRDYKNVYDDIYAMGEFQILNVVRYGKEKVALGEIETIEIRV